MTTNNQNFVCDISNIASFDQRLGKPKLHYVDALFDAMSNEYKIIAIADNSLYRKIDEKKRYKSDYLSTHKIIEAPAKCAADTYILQYAWSNDSFIISNDLFREYKQYPREWVENHRISFMIINNQIFFSDESLAQIKSDKIEFIRPSAKNVESLVKVN
ncbi:hypothetical protein NEF87_000222 [Candidatus Lokiarchaeum ossiferum]|uniref:RNase NYN domain-containing protein n=1 Tax=Candidatus Lokiarchaeum ossiferum TaxID=2951803 RepID=A0ABY6HK86_9ARCH|nr:hypothetical protein NEF87_000222 [Candidatus Lokiarchaeum sp. B-35]